MAKSAILRIDKRISGPPLDWIVAADHVSRTMPQCKSCRAEIEDTEAAASIFDLSFLRLDKNNTSRKFALLRAREVGPLCPNCLSLWNKHGGGPPKKKRS